MFCIRAFLLPFPVHTAITIPLLGIQVEEELLEMVLFSTAVVGLGKWQERKPLFPTPNTSTHIPFWLRFLVLAAYQAQLSKELLVPLGALGDPSDSGSA